MAERRSFIWLKYLYGIKSEHKFDEEVSLNLAYRWFCGLDLMHRVPDHSTKRLVKAV
ncbi:MAG: transposase [Lachnospiraceae bacterium]|nr:transposase [Lachnospiraceae bacterium]